MKIPLFEIFLFLLVASEWVGGEDTCIYTNWVRKGHSKCPKGMEEMWQDDNGRNSIAACCPPDSAKYDLYKRSAIGCQETECVSSSPNLCNSLNTRTVKGKTLVYDEILRDSCIKENGKDSGEIALCYPNDSIEGYLSSIAGAEQNEFPHQAKLRLPSDCGGTIYNKRFILTASHCIVDYDLGTLDDVSPMKVILGTNWAYQKDKKYVYRVKRTIPHPQYGRLNGSEEFKKEKRLINDVALLELDRDIDFEGLNVKSLEIAPKTFDPQTYATNVVLIGWGRTDTSRVSAHLQKWNAIVRNRSSCFDYPGPHFEYGDVRDQQLCVGGIFEGIWNPTVGPGDSGGPAICRAEDGKPVQCGVTSYGGTKFEECLEQRNEAKCQPSVYAFVPYFYDWIKENAGEQDPSTFYKPYLYGRPVSKGEYEHQVHITSSNGKPCGGTLIASDTVVTAAQCVYTDSREQRSGLKVESQDGETFTVLKSDHLPGFKRDGDPVDIKKQGNRILVTDNYYSEDLAILKLSGNVDISEDKLAKLPSSSRKIPVGPAFEISKPREKSTVKNYDKLMVRDFRILDAADCKTRMTRLQYAVKEVKFGVTRNYLCAVEKYSGGSQCDRELGGGLICIGDDGSDVLCGVQMFRLCEFAIPNGFTNVALYKDWLNKKMEQM